MDDRYTMFWIGETPHIAVRNSDGSFRVAASYATSSYPSLMSASGPSYTPIVELLRHANLGAAEEAKPKEIMEDKDVAGNEPKALRAMR